jgi:hypothetical protein
MKPGNGRQESPVACTGSWGQGGQNFIETTHRPWFPINIRGIHGVVSSVPVIAILHFEPVHHPWPPEPRIYVLSHPVPLPPAEEFNNLKAAFGAPV